MLCYTNPTSLQETKGNNLLFITTLEKAAGLGVQVLVARTSSNQHIDRSRQSGVILPLDGPVHGGVCNNEGRDNVEDLVAETAEDVEDGSVSGTGQRTLTVRGQRVGGNALGGRATWKIGISALLGLRVAPL